MKPLPLFHVSGLRGLALLFLSAPIIALAAPDALTAERAALSQKAERSALIARFQKACADLGRPSTNLLVGLATSMEKVLPRATPFNLTPAREIELSLARNEKEGLQVVVVAAASPLLKVSVSVSDLKTAAGAVLPREQVQCEVVGYVETKARPPYGTSHMGWWPDPILNFLGAVDVAAGDLQSFWIRVHAPQGQAPGVYRGTLSVSAEDVVSETFPLTVRVRSFTLPKHSPLPVAITFSPHDYPAHEKQPLTGEYRDAPEYPVNAWKKHKLAWAEMLADYCINYDSLYRHGPPDFEVVPHLHQRKQLVAFNLGNFDGLSRDPAAGNDALKDLRTAYAIILEEIIRQREASAKALTPADREWLTNAKAALSVPGELVKSMTEYSTEPAQLYAWRNRIGDLIDSSGAADVNPWGPNFGVRGLAAVRATTRSIPLLTEQGPDGEFPGWRSFHETPGTRTAEVWQLQPDGVLICKGRPRGYLYTEQNYQDFTLQFEWRYPPAATNSNGGALVRMTGEHGIWPRCLEFQLNQNQAGDFWAIRGFEFTGPAEQLRVMTNASFGILRHLKRQADREKPVGEWNQFEGIVDGGTVTQKVNGAVVNLATGCDVVPGKILLTSEGQEIQFRNLRLVPRQ